MKIFINYSFYAYGLTLLMGSLFFMPSQLQAQTNNCAQLLSEAQLLYSNGNLQQVPPSLESCLETGFTQEERVKAYRLIMLVYLFTDQMSLAEETFVKLLKLNPNFSIDQDNDPIILKNLYSKYRTSPVLTFHSVFAINQTQVSRSLSYATTDTPGEYSSKTGFHIGLGADIYLQRKFSIQFQLVSAWYNFGYSNTLLDYSSLSYQEQQHWINLPVSFAYHLGTGKWRPYIFAGGQAQYLLTAKADLSRIQDVGANQSDNGIAVQDNRYKQQYYWHTGVGVHYRSGRIGAMMQASYNQGLFNQAPTNLRYSNQSLLYKFGYVDDDFKLNHWKVEIGVTFSIYNPKKLKDKQILFTKERLEE